MADNPLASCQHAWGPSQYVGPDCTGRLADMQCELCRCWYSEWLDWSEWESELAAALEV